MPLTNTKPTEYVGPPTSGQYYAETAAGANVPAAPSDSEKTTGVQSGQTYTSAFANWVRRTLDKWIRHLSEAFETQHESTNGGHLSSTFTPAASGQVGVDVLSHASDASSQTKLRVKDSGGSTRFFVRSDGQANTTKLLVTGTPTVDVTKIATAANGSDAGSTRQLDIGGTTATVFAVWTNGTIETAMPTYTIALSPGMFTPMLVPGGATDTHAKWEIDTTTYNGQINAADSTARWLICPEMRLQDGDTITNVTLYADRNAGAIALYLRNKSAFGTTQEVGAAAIISGSGNRSAAMSSGMPHLVTDAKAYYWVIEKANGGSANDIKFQYATITIARARVR